MCEACTQFRPAVTIGTAREVCNVVRYKRLDPGCTVLRVTEGWRLAVWNPAGAEDVNQNPETAGAAARRHYSASASAAIISSTGSAPIESRSNSGSIPLAASSARPAAVFTRS